MKQHYFVVVLAHSLHGRLRRIHIPHQALYVTLGLALFGSISLFGMVSSYLRMSWKVANYNSLREEVNTLRSRYQDLQRENNEKQEQLASLQLMASEVSIALGMKRSIEGADTIAEEGPLVPSYRESIEEYNFLKSASFSRVNHIYARSWQKMIPPFFNPGPPASFEPNVATPPVLNSSLREKRPHTRVASLMFSSIRMVKESCC